MATRIPRKRMQADPELAKRFGNGRGHLVLDALPEEPRVEPPDGSTDVVAFPDPQRGEATPGRPLQSNMKESISGSQNSGSAAFLASPPDAESLPTAVSANPAEQDRKTLDEPAVGRRQLPPILDARRTYRRGDGSGAEEWFGEQGKDWFADEVHTGPGSYPLNWNAVDNVLPAQYDKGFNGSMRRRAYFVPEHTLKMLDDLTAELQSRYRRDPGGHRVAGLEPQTTTTARLMMELGARVLRDLLQNHQVSNERDVRKAAELPPLPELEFYLEAVRREFPEADLD